ncbi:mobilization protein [Acinetobacter baumannii]
MTDDLVEQQEPKEKKAKLTLEQKIEQQEQKLKQLKAQKQAAEAKEKARQKEQDRKDDTRIKILLGSYLKKKMNNNPEYNSKILDELENYLTEERDRKLFGLAPLDD